MYIKKYFYFTLILLIATIWSCTKEDEPLAIQTIKPLPDTVYIKGQNPVEIIFQIKGENDESNNIESVSFYKNLEIRIPRFPVDSISYSPKKILKIVNQVPSELSISIEDLIKDTEYRDIDDIPLASTWRISWEVKLKDGQIISSQNTSEIQYQCLSNLEGNYKATHNDCNMSPVNVTIEKLFQTYYRDYTISDLSAGQFNCLGQNVKLEFSLREECGEIIPSSEVEFGYRFSILEGSRWNEATNTLTIKWYSTVEDKVIISTFVRQ